MIDCMLTKNKIQRLLPEKRSGSMSKTKDLFDYFGQVEFGITLPAENTLEENARLLAEHHAKNI